MQLPDDLQYAIWRMYFSKHVLTELTESGPGWRCSQCMCHGLPCRSCAVFKYYGRLGYGHVNGVRYMFTDEPMHLPDEIEFNLLTWLLLSGGPNLVITTTTEMQTPM